MDALTLLMPASQAAAWIGLILKGTVSIRYTAAFYWCWAVKNIAVGPLNTDLGIVTFSLVLPAASAE